MEGIRKHNPIDVPEGYFDSLRTRLEAIPHEERAERGVWEKLMPYASLAACFAVLTLAGNAVLHRTIEEKASSEDEELYYAGLSNSFQNELLLGNEVIDEPVSEDDIINYLIESSVSEQSIAYLDMK